MMHSRFDFAGADVVVVGASRAGIGAAIARASWTRARPSKLPELSRSPLPRMRSGLAIPSWT